MIMLNNQNQFVILAESQAFFWELDLNKPLDPFQDKEAHDVDLILLEMNFMILFDRKNLEERTSKPMSDKHN